MTATGASTSWPACCRAPRAARPPAATPPAAHRLRPRPRSLTERRADPIHRDRVERFTSRPWSAPGRQRAGGRTRAGVAVAAPGRPASTAYAVVVPGRQVELVLDAPDLPEGERAGVVVHHARRRGRDAADDRIRELLAERPGPFEVITSDRALREDAQRLGAAVVGAGRAEPGGVCHRRDPASTSVTARSRATLSAGRMFAVTTTAVSSATARRSQGRSASRRWRCRPIGTCRSPGWPS